MNPSIVTLMADAYHADEIGSDRASLSASIASILCTASPAHARAAHPKLAENFIRKDEEKFSVGTLAHQVFLEGESKVEIVYADSWRTKAAKEEADLARAHGRIPLLEKNWAEVQAMCAAIRPQLEQVDVSPALFTEGKPEQTLVWEEDGVLCRSRLDWLRDDHTQISDLKTTSRSASHANWSRTALSIGADVQACMYLRGLKAVTGIDADFKWAVVETFPPFALSVFELAPDARALAERKVDFAIKTWRKCLAEDSWPAYPPSVASITVPAYEEMRWLDKEALEEEKEITA